MKKITREEFYKFTADLNKEMPSVWYRLFDQLWSRIQEAQSSEPMSVEEVRKVLMKGYHACIGPMYPNSEWELLMDFLAQLITPLTVQQGFMPDWSKAQYDGVKGVTWQYVYQTEEEMGHELGAGYDGYIPRPTPKMRPKTIEEKVQAIRGSGMFLDVDKLKESTLDDLLSVKGISLETEV